MLKHAYIHPHVTMKGNRYIGLGVRVGCLFLVRCLAIPLEKYSVAFPHAFFYFLPNRRKMGNG